MSGYIKNVAIVGAGGNSGSYMALELLKTGKHTVTAITRDGSQSKLPKGIHSKVINYDDQENIVQALKGQDALVITVSVFAAKDTETKLLKAAFEAGVPWILPNDWSPDTEDENVCRDVAPFQEKPATRQMIKNDGRSSYISVSTGFWYEWSLAIPAAYGIDTIKHEATLFDDGETKISTSTWPQVGRAVAALLSLPVKAEGSGKGLEDFRNKVVYVNSFTLSQKEMLESAYRVTGTKESDWKITKEPAQQRWKEGIEAMKQGDRMGFARMMYTRVFYADGNGDFESSRGTQNNLLGLPIEDLDEATKRAVERSKQPQWG